MAGFDVDAALRWARFHPRTTLARRDDRELPFADSSRIAGQGLLLDTCVYIDQLQGRAPPLLEDLMARRQVCHSSVAIQELMHSIGSLHPGDRRTAGAVAAISRLVRAMPRHRTFAPDLETLGRAALLSGVLSRIQGYGRDGKLRALQDCTLFLQARRLGLVALTANLRDFDILLQLLPSGRALFYRRV